MYDGPDKDSWAVGSQWENHVMMYMLSSLYAVCYSLYLRMIGLDDIISVLQQNRLRCEKKIMIV